MKKSDIPYYLLPITFLFGLIPLVRAGPLQGIEQLTDGLREVIYILVRFISEAILEVNSFDEFLFSKLILFIIVLLIVYTVIKNNGILGDNKKILWIIASAISILAIRFIPRDLIAFILFQYGALGAGIAIFFPFMIFLFFLHQSDIGSMPRKMGWVIFGASYIAIWAFSQDRILGAAEYLYWGGILAVAIAYFFDTQIHARFGDLATQRSKTAHQSERYRIIKVKIKEIDDGLATLTLPPNVVKQEEKRRKDLYKQLKDISRTF